MTSKVFEKLFEPGKIGAMELKNRIVMPPMATGFASDDGSVTDRLIAYYEERAKSGPGLIIVEITCIDSPVGRGLATQINIDDDRFIPGLARLARAIKQHGVRAAIQLHHAGRQTSSRVTGFKPVAPSPIPGRDGEMPKELTVDEIKRLVECFAQGARRAREAGFDGVEIHGAHGYLVSQFLSPLSNKREDEYGGSVENRARFLVEIIKAVRSKVGHGFPLWCRLSAVEMNIEGGITLEETKVVARLAQEAGVDAIHVSAHSAGVVRRPPMAQPPGALIEYAEGVKKAVSVPVIAVGRITPELGEEALRQGKADFIAMGRQFLADAHVVEKIADGRLDDITPCLRCFFCLDSLGRRRGKGVQCVVNPTLGREREWALLPAGRPKKVVVVGGGPGGMQAAIIAAQRGHRVTLFERANELGGQLLLAARPPFKDNIEVYRRYLVNQVTKLGVEVRLGQKFTPELLPALKPDVVVLATGVEPFIPEIPGIRGKNVLLANQVLNGAETGQRVAIIGGELVGCETALYLLEKGKQVTIMRRGARLATKVNRSIRGPMLERLRAKGATILTGVDYQKITSAGVVIKDNAGKEKIVEADTVVLATGATPNDELVALLKGKVPRLVRIGDCVTPRSIKEAVEEGYQAGMTI